MSYYLLPGVTRRNDSGPVPGRLCVAAREFTDWRILPALSPLAGMLDQVPLHPEHIRALILAWAHVLLRKCQRWFRIGSLFRWRPKLSLHLRSGHRAITAAAWCITVPHSAVLRKALVSLYRPSLALVWRFLDRLCG